MSSRFALQALARLPARSCRPVCYCLTLAASFLWAHPAGATDDGGATFRHKVKPILEEFCYDCHADGANKGNVAFDEFKSDQAALDSHELWLKALKNLRAGLMPPARKSQPSAAQKQEIEHWIKSAVFKADPQNPDPGRVTVRRLNRVEYRNTIRDLMDVDFDAEKEFPPDDASHGFDNIGDVLTLPPMLLEKYFAAAQTIVSRAVPSVPFVPAETVIPGRKFERTSTSDQEPERRRGAKALVLSYYQAADATHTFQAPHSGQYQLLLDFAANERFVDNQFDYNKCRLIFRADGQELFRRDYTREGSKAFHHEFDVEWAAGDHDLTVEVQPLTPGEKQVRSLALRLDSVTVRGPMEEQHWVRPKNYERYFGQGPPDDPAERRQFGRELLQRFVEKAYRRPVEPATLDRLVALAEGTYDQPGKPFEAGISQAMIAVLASPRFLFREEGVDRASLARLRPADSAPAAAASGQERLKPGASVVYAPVDEYALASRLSYFLWSSMPDDELFRLARAGQLREQLAGQTKRMLADAKGEAFVRNFVGQWLQVRDIETIQIDARQVLARETTPDPEQDQRRQRFRELRDKEEDGLATPEEKKEIEQLRSTLFRRFNRTPRAELTGELRRAMRQETEKTFEYVLREDRSLVELLNSDYTFLNERLAAHYGLTNLNVRGDEMRLVKLPPEDVRGGGVVTHGAILALTSNPTRTSPVKRGLFILDNLLGTPPAPPPPDIPPLEEAARAMRERKLSLRETLALHREQVLCSSCHNRMDPLGLALENFNAMGMWRDKEQNQPIDATGKLLTGETFNNAKELKQVLASSHATEFYRTVAEKLLTYALGRGLEYYDVMTVDAIVERLIQAEGRPSALITAVIESAPFQKTRAFPPSDPSQGAAPVAQRADLRTEL